MKRFAFASSVIVLLAFGVVSVFAQAKPAQAPATKAAAPPTATPAATPPAAPAKFIKPLKGTADVQFMEVSAKKVGTDIVTILKVKNMSGAPVSLDHTSP